MVEPAMDVGRRGHCHHAPVYVSTSFSVDRVEIAFSPIPSYFWAMDIIRIIAAILLPPLGVFLQVGLGGHFWLNILLTLLGYIPGIVHAVWIIAKK